MNTLQKVLRLVRRYELLLYIIAVAFVSKEVLATQWQLNEDGYAHIYNSIVARELIFHPGSALENVFELNSTPVPNCLGHIILGTLTSFLPLDVADKILHLLLVWGMCFSFRLLVRQINPEDAFYSWLILPLVYTGVYYLGFYNFALGIALFLLTTGTWMWAEKKPRSIWRILLITFLSTALLLCHLIPFLLFVFVAGSKTLLRLFRKEYRSFFIEAGILLLTILPAIILTVIYYTGRTEATGDYAWADPEVSFNRLVDFKHLVVHTANEQFYARILSIALQAVAVASIVFFLIRRKTQSAAENSRFFFWGFCWLFLIMLVFVSPDDFGGSGAMTFRLLEISVIFLLLFIAAGKVPKSIVAAMAVVSFAIAIIMINIRKDDLSNGNKIPKKVMRISQAITANSTGVYIPLVGNWLFLHAGELAFAEKKSAMLSNYETVHDFFPLKWNKNFKYNYTIGGLRSADLSCSRCYWPANDKPEKHIDYVLLCKEIVYDSACYNRLNDSLQKYYILKKEEDPFYLYQSRQSIGTPHQ